MSGEKDFTVSPVGTLTNSGSAISKKPSYLITLNGIGAKAGVQRFITLDKPDMLDGFIQAKGVYLDETEDEIINNLSGVLTSIKKELVLEVMFPWHRICSIRNLVFNAVKTQTLVR